jgi:hypothetical protein
MATHSEPAAVLRGSRSALAPCISTTDYYADVP